MSKVTYANLQRINAEVNELPYVADAGRYGAPEWWDRIDKEGGDCEDYALGKLNRLIEIGCPIGAMRLGCAYVETGEYHAVLAVETEEKGTLVLDNRQPTPCTLTELDRIGYKPDRIQREGGSREWVKWEWQ